LNKQVYAYAFIPSYLYLGIGFVIADIIVTAVLAPFWQQIL